MGNADEVKRPKGFFVTVGLHISYFIDNYKVVEMKDSGTQQRKTDGYN
jgi:hypothetical protein